MKTTNAILTTAFLGLWGVSAQAAVTIDITQDGGNVLFTDSGSADLTDLSQNNTDWGSSEIIPYIGGILPNPIENWYGPVSGPSNFGAGPLTRPDRVTGGGIGVYDGDLILPTGYVSGSFASETMTFDSTTISALGLTPGSYEWTWGTGSDADSLTLNVEPVPEPITLALAAMGGAGVLLFRRRK